MGAAYDSRRDVYWITDWVTRLAVAIDPLTGAAVQTIDCTGFSTGSISDCGYHPGADKLIIGDRGLSSAEIMIFDIGSGLFESSFTAQASGFATFNPPGITVSSSGDLWHSHNATNRLYQVESGLVDSVFLDVAGTLPGSVTLSASGLTPNGFGIFVYGTAGTFIVQSGTCAGLILDIANPTLSSGFLADPTGKHSLTVGLPAGAIGITLQVVDSTACLASNPVVLQ